MLLGNKRRRLDAKQPGALTINGVSMSEGDTQTITASSTAALTAGTNLSFDSGTTFDGSTAKTLNLTSYPSVDIINADLVKQKTTNANIFTVQNTGSSTNAGALTLASTSGGITAAPAANKNFEVTTSGTGAITKGGVEVPTISSTSTLTNKTILGTDNTVYRTTSRMKYTTTVATAIGNATLTYMPFATTAESAGRLATEISVTYSNRRFGNNAGTTRYWNVTCQMFTTGNTHVIVIDKYNSSDQLLSRFTAAVGTNTNDVAVSAVGVSMAQGDYITCGLYHPGAGLTLYYSAGPPTIISTLIISE